MSVPLEIRHRKMPTVVSVFSGGGGLDLGLEMAGFRTLVAVEWEDYACETLRANQAKGTTVAPGRRFLENTHILEQDLRRVSGKRVLDLAGVKPGELDVLCGGPPCVSFSVAGPRKGLASETGRLFEDYARMLRVLRPASFIFENVRGLLTAVDENGQAGGAWTTIRARLVAAGYRLAWRQVDAADYGIPQHRHRVVVVGFRGRRGPLFEFPPATHSDPRKASELSPWRTVEDALAGLPTASVRPVDAELKNHVSRSHTSRVQDAYAATPPGARNESFKRDRLRGDRPAKVVRAQGKPKGDGSGQRHSGHQSIHPAEPRQLTIRECARLQSFPDWYDFPETFSNGYRVVGDAVPPELARIIGTALRQEVSPALKQPVAA